jgi:hypothetical protein
MRRLCLALILIAVPAFADEKGKPNTLTPKEIADGWILLFDGETTFGWKTEGEVNVKDGMLVIGGKGKGSAEITLECGRCECKFDESSDGIEWKSKHLGSSSGLPLRRLESDSAAKYFRSFKLLPGGMTSLFNAKDLTGWKVYDPDKAKAADPKMKPVAVKSQFTMTKEDWLNVKNGPGDLQTEGQWADFVVQLECISNGKHLNSGLFFRAIPDLYQQGYEAQIRNEWMGDDRTKPVDYGTGAIYRRVPARKVVSSDGEWFTMTVAAHGRHLATWVNGYQVVDWTDDRKESDNARNGFKKGKGCLSIQGHDSTTDLSFRNIRIQSLDAK